MKIKKAIVPVAGFGTRFLPASKAIPKEMFPIVDKPVVEYVVEELIDAGIEQIIFVTSHHKTAINNHFGRFFELEEKLKAAGKDEYLDKITQLADAAEYIFVRQKDINGNGGAILSAKNIVGDEPFICFWGDDLITAQPSRAIQLMQVFDQVQAPVLGGIPSKDPKETEIFAFCSGKKIKDGIIKVDKIVEKPGPNHGLHNLGISGFASTPELFEELENFKPKEGDELVYVDGFNQLLKKK